MLVDIEAGEVAGQAVLQLLLQPLEAAGRAQQHLSVHLNPEGGGIWGGGNIPQKYFFFLYGKGSVSRGAFFFIGTVPIQLH